MTSRGPKNSAPLTPEAPKSNGHAAQSQSADQSIKALFVFANEYCGLKAKFYALRCVLHLSVTLLAMLD